MIQHIPWVHLNAKAALDGENHIEKSSDLRHAVHYVDTHEKRNLMKMPYKSISILFSICTMVTYTSILMSAAYITKIKSKHYKSPFSQTSLTYSPGTNTFTLSVGKGKKEKRYTIPSTQWGEDLKLKITNAETCKNFIKKRQGIFVIKGTEGKAGLFTIESSLRIAIETSQAK